MSADRFLCKGYGVEMSFFHCLENQLSDFCLPDFPCHTCEAPLTINPAPRRQPAMKIRYPKDWANMTPAVRRSYQKGAADV
ncbi:MAG: hypothetical protein WC356_01460 [Candidatus Micrarchaeia archaeon]|jgi:hypothetical protein